MYRLVSYNELDSSIQTYMSNQAPDSSTRLEYINNFLKELSTEFNIDVAKRSVNVSLTPDGEAVDITDIVDEDDNEILDINKIYIIRDLENGLPTNEYYGVKNDIFTNNYLGKKRMNEWSFYTENNRRYLKLNSATKSENEEADFKIEYFTSNLAFDTVTELYLDEAEISDNCNLLLPYNYKRLAVVGICRDLFLISLGKDGETPAAIADNRYKSQLKRLGLSGDAEKIKTDVRKVKIYPMITGGFSHRVK